MDIASFFGMVLGIGLLAGSIVMAQGSSYRAFLDCPSFLIVCGGTLAAVMVCFPLRELAGVGKVFKRTFFNRPPDFTAVIQQMVYLAEIARREGLLALENRLDKQSSPFLVRGMQMAIDGTRPDILEDILRTEMESLSHRRKNSKMLVSQMGRFAPAFGMIGTLIGLVVMLGNISSPDKIGSGIAVALITTLYGAIIANLFCLPLVEKLTYLDRQELLEKEIILRGILAIQAGDNPRVIDQRLRSFLPEEKRLSIAALHQIMSPPAKKFEVYKRINQPPRKAA
jgi:chemotaxis protein MotA